MAIWGAVVTGVVAAGSSYYQASQAKKAQKNQLKADRSEWEQRMAYENEKLARKQNSMGAKMAPYLMDQMLHVYGEQTKGRGGFTLPIDEILKNMNIEGRKNGTYNSQPQGQNYDSEQSYGVRGISPKEKNEQRKLGLASVVGRADPELEGYNGKGWTDLRDSATGEGVSAFDVAGRREFTRSMGNTKTQTERGYSTVTKPLAPGSPMTSTEQFPNIEGELATGGVGAFAEGDIEIPKDLAKRLGVAGLKVGMSTMVPGIGVIMNIGGKLIQKFGHSNGKQSALETLLGIKDANYGRFFGKSKTPAPTQQASGFNPLGPYTELL